MRRRPVRRDLVLLFGSGVVLLRGGASSVRGPATLLGAGMLLRPPRQLWPFIAGVAVLDVVANAALMFAFQHGMLSMVSVIGALYPAATVLLATTVLGERVGPDRRIGMVLAVAAVAMITFAS